jgi:hypothetical protein
MRLNKRAATRVTSSESSVFIEGSMTIDTRSSPATVCEIPQSLVSTCYRSSSGSYTTPSGYKPNVTPSPSSLMLNSSYILGSMTDKRSQFHDDSFLVRTPDSGSGDSPDEKKYVWYKLSELAYCFVDFRYFIGWNFERCERSEHRDNHYTLVRF